jgi:hypothetical protein
MEEEKEMATHIRAKTKKPVRLGAGTGVPCPYNGE